MRKVVARLLMTLDGVVESPDKWEFDSFDDDMRGDLGSQISGEDAMLLGRTTYEEWEPYWPTSAIEPFASHINRVPKFVASTTLEGVKWGERDNATLIGGDLAEAISDLKRRPGKNIGVHGSPTLIGSMLRNDLLDEIRLAVYPVVAGEGKRLFGNGRAPKRLKLVDSRTTAAGVSLLTYEPAGKNGSAPG
ncbi:MAG: dihydrofolate reductase family protein [Rubrobacteraceae bacterium]